MSYRIANYFAESYTRVSTSSGAGTFYISGTARQLDVNASNCVRYPAGPGTCYVKGQTFVVNGWNVKVYDADYSLRYADIGIVNRSYAFTGFDSNNRIDIDRKTIISDSNRAFSFVKSNYYITPYGNGRSLWIANYDTARTDINQLLKASVLWASGERFKMDQIYKDTASQSYFEYSYLGILDGFEPFKISLLAWNVFY